jgi:acyl carrier protein
MTKAEVAQDREHVRAQLREFILLELVQNPRYPLGDDEPLISGGLIDSYALALVAVFIESAFGVNLPDTDLTPESMDTLSQMVTRVVEAEP